MNRLTHVALATVVVATGFASAASADHPQREGAVRPAFTQVQRVDGTIVDVAAGNPAFSTLVTALQAADLVTTLQGPGPFTVFAPTNEAFAKIPAGVLNEPRHDCGVIVHAAQYLFNAKTGVVVGRSSRSPPVGQTPTH